MEILQIYPPCRDSIPPPKNPIWNHFVPGIKQNGSHIHAHCRGCIEMACLPGLVVELDDAGNPNLSSE